MTRIFFATDIHGSDICWRKFLNAGPFYGADRIILGGDMTGKALVPIVQQPEGHYKATLLEQEFVLRGEDEVREMEKLVKRRGYYPFRTDVDRLAELRADEGKLDALFREQMLGVIAQWMALADERLDGSDVRCYVCPGNDDVFQVDEIIRSSRHVQLVEGQVVALDDHFQMISTGWSNRTPWHTFREEDEDQLAQRIERMVVQLDDLERAVFNFHCPPYATGLDEAPELDEELRPRYAGRAMVPVGSTAVREALERYQPLLSLHGHIHEAKGIARLGRTFAINPGSMYEQGVLQGAVIDLDSRKGVKNYMLTTG